MKLKICFLALLCLFLTAQGRGQELKIGDKVPDVLINNIKGLRLDGVAASQCRLSNFKDKLLIIDFWATWCAPCRAMVPVMDSLQRMFLDEVVFLPVTYEPEEIVAPVIAAMQKIRPFNLPEVTGDVALHRLFPHRALPHYAWIGPTGTVLAITEEKEVTAANIKRMLGGRTTLTLKRDTITSYNGNSPLLVNGNGGSGKALLYHSLLTGYMPGVKAGMRITPFDPLRGQIFNVRNMPFTWLAQLAYGDSGRVFPKSRMQLLTRDSLLMETNVSGKAFEHWLAAGSGFCYELVLPPKLTGSGFAIMKDDIRRLFPQYAVTVERRVLRCLALVRTSGKDRLKSRGGELLVDVGPYSAHLRNAHLSQLMMRLERQFLQNYPLPVVDLTGLDGRVDMDLEAKLYDVPSMNAALAAYDLELADREAQVEVLVIRDSSHVLPKPKS